MGRWKELFIRLLFDCVSANWITIAVGGSA